MHAAAGAAIDPMTAALRPVGVIGAGLMGHGIAFLFARAGYQVFVQDPIGAARDALPTRIASICELLGVEEALLDRVHAVEQIAEAARGSSLVIEAAPEQLPLKRSIFAELDRHAPPDAILASNTSVIPIGAISQGLASAQRIVGAHFWNPPHLVPLVEVIMSSEAQRAAAESLIATLRAIGRHPVLVQRDVPGFIGNRLQHALKREAIALVAAGVCDAQTIDDVVKLGFGARLAVLGPLEQSDLVGLQLTEQIHDLLMPDLDNTPVTHPYLKALIDRGDLGMKTGKGFREWTPEAAQAVRDRLSQYLLESAQHEKLEN